MHYEAENSHALHYKAESWYALSREQKFWNTVFEVSVAVPSQRKIPKFQLIFLCGNFVET